MRSASERPVKEEVQNYDSLPEWIKLELFKSHSHDKKGNIVYDEKDIIKLIYKILSK